MSDSAGAGDASEVAGPADDDTPARPWSDSVGAGEGPGLHTDESQPPGSRPTNEPGRDWGQSGSQDLGRVAESNQHTEADRVAGGASSAAPRKSSSPGSERDIADLDERAALAALAELVGLPPRRSSSPRERATESSPRTETGRRARLSEADSEGLRSSQGGLFTLAAVADGQRSASTGGRAGRHAGTSPSSGTRSDWWWRYGFPSLLALLVLAVPLLVWRGYGMVLESNEGRVVRVERQPDEPGWEALVEPTPTLLVAHVDPDGKLAAAIVLAQTGDTESGMMLIPPTTALTSPEDSARYLTAEGAFESGGWQLLADYVGATLNAAIGETQVVESTQLADLLQPAGPLTVDNAETVNAATGQRFPKGQLVLQPKDVPVYLSARSPKSDDLDRMKRYKKVFAAWLDKIAASGDQQIIPGEAGSGLGAFLRKFAATQVAIEPIPATATTYQGATFYAPLPDQLKPLVVKMIPFAVGSPPGARPRVRVLDGTGQLDHGLGAVSLLVFGGAEVASVGNAARFDFATTQIIYYDDAVRETAEGLRETLGVGEVVKSEQQGEVVELTVILGSDWSELPIAKQQPPLVTSAPSVVGTSIKGR